MGATKAVLHWGVNVHVKNTVGLVAESAYRRVREYESLYAGVAACMALAIDAGAVEASVVTQGHPQRRPSANASFISASK